MSRSAVLTVVTNLRSATGFASQAIGLARSARARVVGSEKAETKMLRMPNRSRISAAASIPSRGPASRTSIRTSSGL